MSVDSHKTAMPPLGQLGERWQSSTEDRSWEDSVSVPSSAPISTIDSSWSAPVPVPLIATTEVGVHADSTWDPERSKRASTQEIGVDDIVVQPARPAPPARATRPARMDTVRGHGRDPTVVVVPLPTPALVIRPFSERFAPRPPRRHRWLVLGVVGTVAAAIAMFGPKLSSRPPTLVPAASAPAIEPVAPAAPAPSTLAASTASGAQPAPATAPAAKPDAAASGKLAPAPPRPSAKPAASKLAAKPGSKPAATKPAKPKAKPTAHATVKPTAKPATPRTTTP